MGILTRGAHCVSMCYTDDNIPSEELSLGENGRAGSKVAVEVK
jgi:hypothetical protein